MGKVTVAFSLDSEADADILQDLAELPSRQKSATFREVWRAYRATSKLTLFDVMSELGEIRRALRNGIVVQRDSECETDGQQEADPLTQQAQAAIDDLGKE